MEIICLWRTENMCYLKEELWISFAWTVTVCVVHIKWYHLVIFINKIAFHCQSKLYYLVILIWGMFGLLKYLCVDLLTSLKMFCISRLKVWTLYILRHFDVLLTTCDFWKTYFNLYTMRISKNECLPTFWLCVTLCAYVIIVCMGVCECERVCTMAHTDHGVCGDQRTTLGFFHLIEDTMGSLDLAALCAPA